MIWRLIEASSSFPAARCRHAMMSNLKDAPPQGDGDGMGSVTGLKLVDKILDVEVDCRLRDCEFIRNLLVAVPIPDEPQHVQFSCSKRLISKVFRQPCGYLGRDMSPTGMHRPDYCQKIILGHALQYIRGGTGLQRLLNLCVTLRCSQHDNASLGEFAAYGRQRIGAGATGQTEIHKSYIGTVEAKLLDPFSCIRSLRDKKHVPLGTDDRG